MKYPWGAGSGEGISDSEYLAPLRGEARRKPGLSHFPGAGDALHCKEEGIAAINLVDGVHDMHQPGLPIVVIQRKFTEEVRLYTLSRDDFREVYPGLFIVIAVFIHSFQCVERIAYKLRGKGRGVGNAQCKGIGVLR